MKCEGCSKECFIRENGKLVARQCYFLKMYKSAYSPLLVGLSPTQKQVEAILSTDIKPNSMVFYQFPTGKIAASAVILMKLKVFIFQHFHTHYLIDVKVSKSEEDLSLRQMYSSFYLLLHGFVDTPNVRLLDLICEFLDYKLNSRIPFLLYTVKRPDPQLIDFFSTRGLSYVEIHDEYQMEVF